jgi:L-ornithine N5-oxygenase
MLDTLYQQMYLERITGTERLRMTTMADLVDARTEGDEIVLRYTDRMTARDFEERCDVVMLGTGFANEMPKLIRDLAAAAGVGEATVDRSYRMNLPESFTATCHLQGVNDVTHGPGDSQMSVLAVRSAEIVSSLLAQEQSRAPLARAS